MAVIVPTALPAAGVAINPTVAASAGGDTMPNTGKTLLAIKNASAAGIVATLVTPGSVDGQAIADRAIPVAAGETRLAGPFPPSTFNDGDGRIGITWSAAASVTVQSLELP